MSELLGRIPLMWWGVIAYWVWALGMHLWLEWEKRNEWPGLCPWCGADRTVSMGHQHNGGAWWTFRCTGEIEHTETRFE